MMSLLVECGKIVVEDAGFMPNPTVEKLYEGVRIARESEADLILAVGGGSVIDYAKAVSVSVHCDDDPWEKYYLRMGEPDCAIVPMGCVLTMAGTGSEMNGGHHEPRGEAQDRPRVRLRRGVPQVRHPEPGQYFSGDDDNVSDYLMEGLMRSLVQASRVAVVDPRDYEARSNIMWAATWALNTLVAKGKTADWEVHMIGQAVGAYTDAAHGMTLSAVSLAYYRLIMPYGLLKFARFARAVWDVDAAGRTDEELVAAGIDVLEAWMREIDCVMSLAELGATEDMLEGIADATFVIEGGYHVLTRDEIVAVLRGSL